MPDDQVLETLFSALDRVDEVAPNSVICVPFYVVIKRERKLVYFDFQEAQEIVGDFATLKLVAEVGCEIKVLVISDIARCRLDFGIGKPSLLVNIGYTKATGDHRFNMEVIADV